MGARIKIRRDTAANWLSSNPTLQDGELGIEVDTRYMKLGNGTQSWSALGYITKRRQLMVTPLLTSNNSGTITPTLPNFVIRQATVKLRCKVASNGYAIGDVTQAFANQPTAVLNAFGYTNFRVAFASALPTVIPKNGGAAVATTTANWEAVIEVEEL